MIKEAIQNLELKLIDNNNYEKYEELLSKIKTKDAETYKQTLRYLLSISEHLNQYSPNEYFFLGGYAVLTHIISDKTEGIMPSWRGSHDVDIVVADINLENYIKGGFNNLIPSRKFYHLPHKKVFEFEEETLEKGVHLDFYYPDKPNGEIGIGHFLIGQDIWQNVEKKSIFGIDVNVPAVRDLLRSKLEITTSENLPREKDMDDILSLLYLDQSKGNTPESLYSLLSPFQKDQLIHIIDFKEDNKGISKDRRLQLNPTNSYLYTFKVLYQEEQDGKH